MEVLDKLKILTDSAKYDVACTSSGTSRSGSRGGLGSASEAGICHSFSADGRCVSLLKVLMSNYCVYDCKYCINRRTNDVPRATFTPREVADLTMNFYKRNYIEGLFLSSAIIKSPNHTMELLYNTLKIVREEYKFLGYIHVKGIPGADENLIKATGLLADRMSVNIELPSAESLKILAPEKTKIDILSPMKMLTTNIAQSKYEVSVYKHAEKFVPAGQSTQMIIGATPDTDSQIISLSEGLYNKFKLKRVFYSAYNPVGEEKFIPKISSPPMLREHRLYQADWLLRFYGFKANDLFEKTNSLSLDLDPKCQWAINNIEQFPVEINKADMSELLKIPGIGTTSAFKIIRVRRTTKITFEVLKKIGVSLKRAKYFITCNGQMLDKFNLYKESLEMKLSEGKSIANSSQVSLFDPQFNQNLISIGTPLKTDFLEKKSTITPAQSLFFQENL